MRVAYTCFQLIYNRQQTDPKDEMGFTFPLVVTVFGSGPSEVMAELAGTDLEGYGKGKRKA